MRVLLTQVLLGAMIGVAGCASAPAQDEAEAPDVDAAEPANEAEPTVVAYDPFAGDMPEGMASALATQSKGGLLEIDAQHWLWTYAQSHSEDARPWLLLGRDSMAREWGGFAVRQYASALEADARVAAAPFLLADLITVAIDYVGLEREEATALIVEYWGSEALPDAMAAAE